MKIASLPVLLLCLLFLLILLIFLSLSLSVSKQHDIFLSTYEFIVVKKSTRVAVFFMFNVIIITIFRGNLKPSTEDTDNWLLSFPHLLVYEARDEATKDETTWELEEYYDEDSDVDHEYNHGYDGYEEDKDDDDDDGGDDGFESEDDQQDKDDLERRIKEFIAKNYRQRREELMYEAGLHGSYRVQKYPALANY